MSEKPTIGVIETGGKQYLVKPGDELKVEKLTSSDKDKKLEFEDLLHNKKVQAEILGETRTKKVTGIKFKKRKGYLKRLGHRQTLTKLKIISIK